VAENCPAEYYALVDIIHQKCWLFSKEEFKKLSIKAGAGRRLGWNVVRESRDHGKLSGTADAFQEFEIDSVLSKLTALWRKSVP